MAILRVDIERALDDLISNEEGMRFQGLAVILAKQRWPELIASERKKDLGADAVAKESVAAQGSGKILASSLTATLGKVREDAKNISMNFSGVTTLIFATPRGVTNQIEKQWATEIQKEFGYELIVMSREDIITSLMMPSYSSLCRDVLQRHRLEHPNIAVDVSVMSPSQMMEQPISPLRLVYAARKSPSVVEIHPELGYLSQISQGTPLCGFHYSVSPFDWEFPNLDIKVVNNSDQTIFLSEVIFDVDNSSPTLIPILVIRANRQGWNARHVSINNEGWAEIESCRITYGLVPWNTSWSQPSDAVNAGLDFSHCPYEFQDVKLAPSANLDVSDALVSEGAKLTVLDNLSKNPDEQISEEEFERKLIEALGPFPDGPALAYGTIEYSWKDSTGQVESRSTQFVTSVSLVNPRTRGIPKPPTFQYHARLEAGGTDYRVSVPISQEIKSGDTDRFNIRIGAERSALHRIRARLIYNSSKELDAGLIVLEMMVPRSGAKRQLAA